MDQTRKRSPAAVAMLTAVLVLLSMFGMGAPAQAVKNPATAPSASMTYYAYVKKGERMYVNFTGQKSVRVLDQNGADTAIPTNKYTKTATADGVWRVIGTKQDPEGASYTVDIRVATGTTEIKGRIWTTEHVFQQNTVGNLAYWGVSDLGYVYKVDLFGSKAYTAQVALRSAGAAVDKKCNLTGKSIDARDGAWNPGYMNCGDQYRLFFEDPRTAAAGLPEYANMAGKQVPVLPKIPSDAQLSAGTKLDFVPNPDNVGGTFTASSLPSFSGTVELQIDTNGNGKFGDLQDFAQDIVVNKGEGEPFEWAGYDMNDRPVKNGAMARVVLKKVGEAHLLLHDFEALGGVTMTRLNGTAPDSKIYYDDSSFTRKRAPGANVPNPKVCLAGCNSKVTGGIHGWNQASLPAGTPNTNNTSWGDGAIVDNWAYATMSGQSEVISVPKVHEMRFAAYETNEFIWGKIPNTGRNSILRPAGTPWGELPGLNIDKYDGGLLFLGWSTMGNWNGNMSGQVLSTDIADRDMDVAPIYRPKEFGVEFDSNAKIGTPSGSMRTWYYEVWCGNCTLPKNEFTKSTGAPELIDTEAGESGDVKSLFMGWSRDPNAKAATYKDGASIDKMSATAQDGEIIKLYAVWDDAPRFNETYSDRYFTLREARTGKITEEELLKSISATDLETNPLETKTTADVIRTKSDVGITILDYDADDYTRLNGEAVISLTYKVKDEAGNVAFLRIKVNVSPSRADVVEMTKSTRGMSDQYLEAAPDEGGLSADSSWRTNESKQESLRRAVGEQSSAKYCFSNEAVNGLREQILSGDVGKTGGSGGLDSTKSAMREGSCS